MNQHLKAGPPEATAAHTTAADHHDQIRAGLGPATPFPQHLTVLDLFERQVSAAPDRTAVRYRDRALTYRMLNRAATVVARRLEARGAERGRLIPVLAIEGLEFPVGLFAVMKTGAAFVPVDPGWPAARLQACARDLDPPAVLANAALSGAVEAMELASRAVYLDPTEPLDHAPDRRATAGPTDLIYGYYTSGSTGVPKCALNHHRGLVNRLTAMSRRFGPGSGHVTLQNSRATFDSAMWQLLWPLTAGGQVVLPDRDGILDLEQTAYTVARYGVTMTDFVPSVLAAFVSLLETRPDLAAAVGCLSRILVGGEVANRTVLRRLHQLLPHVALTNTYGPTECSIGSVFHEIDPMGHGKVPLGRPIDNTAAIVMGEDGRPVPRGEIGEIYLGGACVGAGYLNDPERTAAAFVPNPFPDLDGKVLYRTGDLAYLDQAGEIHFVGRRDDQVKVNGVRIELSDVETILTSHPLVGAAACVVLGGDGDSALACGVSARSADHRPDEADLLRYATGRLPAEMVPHRLVVLDALPVSQHGKTDRRALVDQLAAAAAAPAAADAPADAVERLVAAAWCQVLGRDHVSAVVPFSDYGGSSLTAFRLTVALSTKLERPVRPRDLVAATTVRQQAARIRGTGPDDTTELAQMERDAEWRPARPIATRQVRRADAVLLTGATGFIGAHLLAELLTTSGIAMVCLVRAAGTDDAVRRLRSALAYCRLPAAGDALAAGVRDGRVVVEAGRLEAEFLGLPRDGYERLTARIQAVIHAGALVNLLAGYAAHRPANVVGAQQILRLAAAAGGCPVHALSTLSIFGGGHPVPGHTFPTAEQLARHGYGRSKYVAERLLQSARRRGIGSVVYRLGEVWPHQHLGVPNPTSFAHGVLYACMRTGCVFDTQATTTVTPVDAVAARIVADVMDRAPLPDGPVHLLWPATVRLRDIFAGLAAGRPLDHVPYSEFRDRVGALTRKPEPDPRLVRLNLLLPPPSDGTGPESVEFDHFFGSAGDDTGAPAIPHAPVGPFQALAGYLREVASVPGPQPPATN